MTREAGKHVQNDEICWVNLHIKKAGKEMKSANCAMKKAMAVPKEDLTLQEGLLYLKARELFKGRILVWTGGRLLREL